MYRQALHIVGSDKKFSMASLFLLKGKGGVWNSALYISKPPLSISIDLKKKVVAC